mgnify:CR=1 FL=1
MKKYNNFINVLLDRFTDSKDNKDQYQESENYTNMVNNFKARIELQ